MRPHSTLSYAVSTGKEGTHVFKNPLFPELRLLQVIKNHESRVVWMRTCDGIEAEWTDIEESDEQYRRLMAAYQSDRWEPKEIITETAADGHK